MLRALTGPAGNRVSHSGWSRISLLPWQAITRRSPGCTVRSIPARRGPMSHTSGLRDRGASAAGSSFALIVVGDTAAHALVTVGLASRRLGRCLTVDRY